jgi:RNA polymerase sigma-70 factor (ECF subfamily)
MKYKTKFPVYNLTEDLGYSLEEIIDPNPANNPETELLSNQAKVKCLHSLTECLQAKERKVFCLSITLGLPQKHVAAILDCSVGSVKTTLHRAKQRWFGYMEDRCQLIRKSNPCNCKQWVRFGLSQGWITNQTPAVSSPSITSQARKEISDLRRLRDIYHELYQARAEETFANRIMDGMNKREWAFLG